MPETRTLQTLKASVFMVLLVFLWFSYGFIDFAYIFYTFLRKLLFCLSLLWFFYGFIDFAYIFYTFSHKLQVLLSKTIKNNKNNIKNNKKLSKTIKTMVFRIWRVSKPPNLDLSWNGWFQDPPDPENHCFNGFACVSIVCQLFFSVLLSKTYSLRTKV